MILNVNVKVKVKVMVMVMVKTTTEAIRNDDGGLVALLLRYSDE